MKSTAPATLRLRGGRVCRFRNTNTARDCLPSVALAKLGTTAGRVRELLNKSKNNRVNGTTMLYSRVV